jgi:PEGA domain
MSTFLPFGKRAARGTIVRASQSGSTSAARIPDEGLLTFPSENGDEAAARSTRHRTAVVCAAVLLGLASAAVVYVASTRLQAARSAASADLAWGTAFIDSSPPGSVTIEGVVRGLTPISLRLPPGTHHVAITAGEATRSLSLEIEGGTTTKQYIELPAAPAPVAPTGRLDVSSQPSGARVSVDGAPRGTTPLSIAEIAAGSHHVTISSGDTTIHRSVTIRSGATSSVDASIAAPDSAAGWLAIASPVELTLTEGGQIVGTTRAAKLMLPAGTHNLVAANTALEFQTSIAVRIEGGKTLTRAVALPNGSLSVNAVPWANVFVDGDDVGTTPLANLALPVGSHEIVWRHPQLGERRRTVAITAKTPTRIGMDFKP